MKSLLSCVSVCDEMDTQGELVMIVEIMKKEAYVVWMVLVVVGVVVARVVAAPSVTGGVRRRWCECCWTELEVRIERQGSK